MTNLTPAAELEAAAARLADEGSTADLTVEYPNLDACVAALLRSHAILLRHGGQYASTAQLLRLARRINAEEPQPEPECEGFHWIGQSMTCCDNCGRPIYEHKGWHKPGSPFGDEPGTLDPFTPEQLAKLRARWEPQP